MKVLGGSVVQKGDAAFHDSPLSHPVLCLFDSRGSCVRFATPAIGLLLALLSARPNPRSQKDITPCGLWVVLTAKKATLRSRSVRFPIRYYVFLIPGGQTFGLWPVLWVFSSRCFLHARPPGAKRHNTGSSDVQSKRRTPGWLISSSGIIVSFAVSSSVWPRDSFEGWFPFPRAYQK